jgi:hypothetical protein
LGTLDAPDAQLVNGSPQGQDVLWIWVEPNLRWVVLTEKG